jgi:hypothetical protein
MNYSLFENINSSNTQKPQIPSEEIIMTVPVVQIRTTGKEQNTFQLEQKIISEQLLN